jgi:HTH domain
MPPLQSGAAPAPISRHLARPPSSCNCAAFHRASQAPGADSGADPTRPQLLELLGEQAAASATALAGQLPVSRQAVVKHLAVLKQAAEAGGWLAEAGDYLARPGGRPDPA